MHDAKCTYSQLNSRNGRAPCTAMKINIVISSNLEQIKRSGGSCVIMKRTSKSWACRVFSSNLTVSWLVVTNGSSVCRMSR